MNLFEILVNLNHRKSNESWVETTAVFTGKRNKAAARTKGGYRELDYFEYEIVYDAGGKGQRRWYTFYPLPDPETDEIKDTSIRIKYNPHKPYIFEATE